MMPVSPLWALALGDAMPTCVLSSFDGGQPVQIEQFKGKVVYVDFWASWCGPCAKSFPFLNQLDTDFKAKGLQILGVNLDEEKSAAQDFLAQFPASFAIVTDSAGQCAKNFAVQGMPSSYLIDQKGYIQHVHLGFRPSEAEEIRALIQQLIDTGSVAHQ
jgi:thiol-disulfide isomerase/thioredoxin